MAETAAISGKGTTIGHATTSGGSYTDLAEVVDIAIPDLTGTSVEATHYLSPDDRIEKIPTGWGETGDCTLKINYEKSQTTTLYGLFNTKLFWKITTPDGSTWVHEGWISKISNTAPNKDKMESTIVITNTGDIPYTAGA